MCAALTGDVVEFGYGSGLNQPHLPPAVTGVWAVEPSETALRLSQERRQASPVPVVVAGDEAQCLDLPGARFDAALCTWVLCGIPHARAALAEVARVLKPGAALHFVEHGLAPDPGIVHWQRSLAAARQPDQQGGRRLRPRQRRGRAAGRVPVDGHRAEDVLPRGSAEAGRLHVRGSRDRLTSPLRVGRGTPGLRTSHTPADLIPMTSPASSASWLPAAIARAAVVTASPAQNVPTAGRHSAHEVPGTVRIATPEDLRRTGRHAEPEWSRDLHDPKRDDVDSLSWLGFTPSRH